MISDINVSLLFSCDETYYKNSYSVLVDSHLDSCPRLARLKTIKRFERMVFYPTLPKYVHLCHVLISNGFSLLQWQCH